MARTFKKRSPSAFLESQKGVTTSFSTPFLGKGRFNHSFEVQLSELVADPEQPRKVFNLEEIEALATSLSERGILQPILVREAAEGSAKWIIVAGERRWRAAVSLGWETLPAIEYDGDYRAASLVENLLRTDLSAVEEARGLRSIMELNNWSQSETGRQLGLSQSRVNRTLRVLDLPSDFLDYASANAVPINVLVQIVREEDAYQQQALMDRVMSGSATVSELLDLRQKASAQSQKATEKKAGTGLKAFKTIRRFIKETSIIADKKVALSEEEKKDLRQARDMIDQLLA
ncbi:ParB/RepB/Spo0J family partition protein [Acetobacter cerevisiae]|uniref:ParB/RepB/Spo0J family partition protein n=1 Tax=Acetobacter cerevisiae TaxID=178900 RepID=UPI0020A12082|nr:ParB/RepB/Spo0J family partition protein [Acetobacter cerevisiae]MCP1271638.1 ParB/RepB/Spo0J family partition protein [Acetobacter cerevisiae]MCP1279592.1 ParB/RepB/Spo0J family partition protein [Acetobacter cerevisiae]